MSAPLETSYKPPQQAEKKSNKPDEKKASFLDEPLSFEAAFFPDKAAAGQVVDAARADEVAADFDAVVLAAARAKVASRQTAGQNIRNPDAYAHKITQDPDFRQQALADHKRGTGQADVAAAIEGCLICSYAGFAGFLPDGAITAYDNPKSAYMDRCPHPPTSAPLKTSSEPRLREKKPGGGHAPSHGVAARPPVNFEKVHAEQGRQPGETATDWLTRKSEEDASLKGSGHYKIT